jgi:preprotein translocase subunit SecE
MAFNPLEYIRETRQEVAKVTWPSRKETVTTTILIVVMALIAGLFFLLVDSVVGAGVSRILGMHS